MKKILFLILLTLYCGISSQIKGQEEKGFFNSLAVGLDVGSEGIGIDFATSLGNHFALRTGGVFMPGLSITTDVNAKIKGFNETEEMKLKGSLRRSSGKLLVNYYPVKNLGLFLCSGIYFGGKQLTDIHGHSDQFQEIVNKGEEVVIGVGDQLIPIDQNGNIDASIEVAGLRSYLGLGFGQAIPKKRVGFMVELGIQIHGTPEIISEKVSHNKPTFDTDDSFSKIIDKLKVYPILKFKISGKLF